MVAFQADCNACFQAEGAAVFYFRHRTTDPYELVTTSRKQQRTKEERSVLLNNNRWICLLPFARKPDPRRVSKQVSREPPQAWLFGLVRLAPQAERKAPQAEEKRRRQANSARRRPEKLRDRSAAISLLFSLGFRSRCSRRAAPPAARCAQRRTAERGRKLLVQNTRKRLWLFFFVGPRCLNI